jgi:TP901 family phage tail tape measure protein
VSDTGGSIFIEFEGNPEQLASELAKVLESALGKAIGEIQRDFAKIFSSGKAASGLKNVTKVTTTLRKGWDAVDTATKQAASSAKLYSKVMAGIRTPDEQFKDVLRFTDRAEKGLNEMKAAEDRIAKDPSLGVHFRALVSGAERLAREAGLNYRNLSDAQQLAFRKMAESERVADQGMTTRFKAEANERIVAAQLEGSRIVAETRSSGARRVAIIQAVTGQIRALERGLASVFRTSAQAFGALVRGAGSAVSRLAGIFRRGDASLDNTIGPAMNRRSGILRAGLTRQEAIVAGSVARQSLQIQRLERRMSTGVLGAATGRSQLGTLLGGGLAIGGGFALISGLRSLATAGADFAQTLAVLDASLQLTDKQMAAVRQTALDLGNDITLPGVSAKDAAEGIQILVKQFGALGDMAVPAALAAAKGTLQLSRAANTTADEAARVVGAAINVFGIQASKAVQVADLVAGALTKAAGTSFSDFALAFRQASTTFVTFQKPVLGARGALVEFNTALAVLAKGGLVGTAAGTALKQFFLQANKGTKDTVTALNLLTKRAGETGSVFFDAAGKSRSLTDALAILRKGLKGMTDEEKASTLQTIFGSRAFQAAKILVDESTQSYRNIRRAIQRQGLAAEIAAAQNHGLRGAMDALGSVIETQGILVYEKLEVVLGNVVVNFADFLNKLLSAEGAFAVARRALLGMAAGLAALLAFKAAGEVLKLFAVAARGLLTPFGLLALAFAGIGAAISVMMDRSVPFRRAIETVVGVLGDLARSGLDFAREKLAQFGDFIVEKVLPPVSRFIQFIAENAISGLRSFAQFVARTVIPPLANFVNFIAAEVVPAVRDLLGRAFEAAGDAIRGFWRVAAPILRPAVDALQTFTEAVAGLFKLKPSAGILALGGVLAGIVGGFALGGPAGAAIGGLGAGVAALFATGLADNLGSALAGVGGVIVDALKGPFERVTSFISGLFTGDRLEGFARGFLDIVERVGFIIANIATDPRVLAAIAAIAAAGALMAARFAEGFARGLIDNLAKVFDTIVNAVGFGGDFTGLGRKLGTALAVGLGAAFIGGQLLGRLRTAATALGLSTGQALGQAVQKGTSTALTVGAAGMGGGPKGLLQGILGGPAAIAGATKDAGRISGALTKEFQRNLFLVQATGRSTFSAIGVAAEKGMAAGVQASRTLKNQAVADFGAARVAGLGVNTAVKDIGQSIKTLNFRGVTTGFANLRGSLVGQGQNIGMAAGTTIAASVGAAFGAQMLVEAKTGGGVALGLASIFGSVATAGAVGGAPAAGIVAAVGGIALAIQALTADTNVAKDAVDGLARAISDAGEQGEFDVLIGRVRDFVGEFKEGAIIDELAKVGFSIDDMVSAIMEGETATSDFFTRLRADFDRAGFGGDTTKLIVGNLEILAQQLQDERLKGANLTVLGGNVNDVGKEVVTTTGLWAKMWEPPADHLTPKIADVKVQLIDGQELADKAKEAIDRLFGRALPSTLRQGMDDLLISLKDFPEQLKGIRVGTVIGQAEVRDAADAKATEFLDIMSEAIRNGEITSVPQVRTNRKLFLEELKASLEKGGMTEAEARVLWRVTSTINAATTKRSFRNSLQDVRIGKLIKQVPVELRPAFEGLTPRELQRAITAQIAATSPTGGGGVGIHGVMARGIPKQSVDVPISINPQITVEESAGGDLAKTGQRLALALAVGVATGAPAVAAALNAALSAAFKSGAQTAAGLQAVGASLSAALARGIASQTGMVVAVAAVTAAGAAQGAASQSGAMVGSGVQIGNSFAVGVLATAGSAYGAGYTLGVSAAVGASGFSLYSAGLNLAYSLASGISSGASAVINAAINIASAAVNAARATLGIRSPSTIFRGIGHEIGRGLAEGIKDSEQTISSAVDEAVQTAIEAARRAVPGQGVARAQVAGRLFEELQPRALPGGVTADEVSRSVDNVFDAIGVLVNIQRDVREQNEDIKEANKGVREQVKQMRIQLGADLRAIKESFGTRVMDAFSRRQEGADIRRQRIEFQGLRATLRSALKESGTVRGTGPNAKDRFRPTLTRGTVRGQANIATILDFGQQIRDFAAQLLESGASARRVTREVGRLRDQMVRTAVSMGFNRGQVNRLVQSLGLSNRQLRDFVNNVGRIGDSVRQQLRRARENARVEVADTLDDLQRRARISTSLGRGTEAGRENRGLISDALQSIREFGQAALEAGTPVATVVERMREMRNQLVQQAVSMGFNRQQIQQLVELMGLSNSQLTEFIKHLAELNEEITNPPVAPPQPGLTIGPGGELPVGFRELHVHVPFGDPEAVAAAVNNRLAFELSTAS